MQLRHGGVPVPAWTNAEVTSRGDRRMESLIYFQCLDGIGQAWAAYTGQTSYHGYRWYIDVIRTNTVSTA